MRLSIDKVLRYVELVLFGLAIFFMLRALAIPVRGLMELKYTQQPQNIYIQPVAEQPAADQTKSKKEMKYDDVYPGDQYSFRV